MEIAGTDRANDRGRRYSMKHAGLIIFLITVLSLMATSRVSAAADNGGYIEFYPPGSGNVQCVGVDLRVNYVSNCTKTWVAWHMEIAPSVWVWSEMESTNEIINIGFSECTADAFRVWFERQDGSQPAEGWLYEFTFSEVGVGDVSPRSHGDANGEWINGARCYDDDDMTYAIFDYTLPDGYLEFHQSGSNPYSETRDTYLDEGNNSNNFGGSVILKCGGNPISYDLISFPYIIGACSSYTIPFGSKIRNAVLHLKTTTVTCGDPFWAARIVTEWSEDYATYLKANARQFWGEPGAEEEDDVYFGEEYEVWPVAPNTSYHFQVTEIVQAWADGQPNYGFFIDVDDDCDPVEWHSSEATTEADRPFLEVWFDLPDGTNISYLADMTSEAACSASCLQVDVGTNYGDVPWLNTTGSGLGHTWKSVIQWSNFIGGGANQIPPNSTIYMARQSLIAQNDSIDEQVMHRLVVDWYEMEVSWWNRYAGMGWSVWGLRSPDDFVGYTLIPSFTPDIITAKYYQFVTDDVRGWVKEDFPNFGWVLYAEDGTNDGAVFYSDDESVTAYRPSLMVYWATPTGGTPPGPPTSFTAPYGSHEVHWDYMEFQSVYNDDGPGGVQAVRYRMQVSEDDPTFKDLFWDSGVPFVGPLNPGESSDWLDYTGTAMCTEENTYYLRMRYYTNLHDEGEWSNTLEVHIVDSLQPLNRKGYHLMELPVDTEARTVDYMFGDNLPSVYLYGYNEASRSYYQPTTLELGKGYFIWSPTDSVVALGTPAEDYENETFTIPLSWTDTGQFDNDGWNLVRTPFYLEEEPLNWGFHFELQNCATTYYRSWNGNEYAWFNSYDDSFGNGGDEWIPEGASFWVHANGSNAFVRIYHPWYGPPPAPRPLPPPMMKWRMPVTVKTGTYRDTSTYLAVRESAGVQHDSTDVLEISPLSTYYIRIFFDHADWGYYSGKYTQDTRPFPAEGESVSWTATVEATGADGTVELGWEIPAAAADWEFVMRDETNGIFVDLRKTNNYSYPASGSDVRDFTITVTRRGEIVLGDADLDGEATTADAVLCCRAEHGLETLSPRQRSVSDLDGDGSIGVLDALLILRRLRGHLPGK
ncbi:MAG: DNRLRE domain-containing protein [Planctomycetota bacterium]|nr:MAG: DNRLRE domain-containing protein [Planctomycetota bacterium]